MIGLKFLLVDGQFLQVVVDQLEAKQIIESWASRQFKLQDKRVFSGSNQHGLWAVEADAVKAIHTFPLDVSPAGPPGLRSPSTWKSGIA